MKPTPAKPRSIIAHVEVSGTAATVSVKTAMQPSGQTVFVGSAPNGTNTSPEIGSTATEWSLKVVLTSWNKVSVLLSTMPNTAPPGSNRAAISQRPVVGSNHT